MRRVLTVVMTALAVACAGRPGVYTTQPLLTHDDDRHPIAQPKEYWSSFYWDGADQMVFAPMSRALWLDVKGPAVDVNAYGEVPNSSWFTNRIGQTSVSPERLVRGPCNDGDALSDEGPWIAKSGKVDGANPGFVIEDAKTHKKYLLKFDSLEQPERATAGDVIGSKLYWAFGAHVPCNFVVFFDPSIIELGKDATKLDMFEHKIPLTEDDLQKAMRTATRTAEGKLRASASLFVPGTPVGPWTYDGVRDDDPNDVVPHQNRRELRGTKLMAAWTQHFDTREQNTLATFMKDSDGPRGWVEHWIIDFGDTLGSVWAADDVSRRFGHSYYFDVGDIFTDLFTFGLIERVWERLQVDPQAPIFGYYDYEHFDPETWKGGYQNPAFLRMNEADGYWAAQIIARFSDAHIDALVAAAHFSKPAYAARLRAVLIGRRNRIVGRYLYRMSSFERPTLTDTQLCFDDVLVATGYEPASTQRYSGREGGSEIWTPLTAGDGGRVCMRVRVHDPTMLEVRVQRPNADAPAAPVRFHVMPQTSGVPFLIGVERVTP